MNNNNNNNLSNNSNSNSDSNGHNNVKKKEKKCDRQLAISNDDNYSGNNWLHFLLWYHIIPAPQHLDVIVIVIVANWLNTSLQQ